MKCYYHPDRDAVGTCSQCGKAGCREDLHDVGGAMLCDSCLALAKQEVAQTQMHQAARAKASILWSWIFTGVVGGLLSLGVIGAAFSPSQQYDATTGSYVQGAPPIAVLLLIPVVLYGTWAFYWGWSPVWGFIRKTIAGWGCFFAATWIVWIIVIAVFFELLFGAILAYGALGGGFYRYNRAKQLAAQAA